MCRIAYIFSHAHVYITVVLIQTLLPRIFRWQYRQSNHMFHTPIVQFVWEIILYDVSWVLCEIAIQVLNPMTYNLSSAAVDTTGC